MITYKDQTWCTTYQNNCTNQDCSRYLTIAHQLQANHMGLPIAWADFSPNCDKYTPQEKTDERRTARQTD